MTETERTRHFLILREKFGMDEPIVVPPSQNHVLDNIIRAGNVNKAMVLMQQWFLDA